MAEYVVDFLNTFVGLRKALVMFSLMILTTVLRVKGYISGDNTEGLLKSTTIAFFGSNGIEHFSAMVKTHLESKAGMLKPVTEIVSKTEEG